MISSGVRISSPFSTDLAMWFMWAVVDSIPMRTSAFASSRTRCSSSSVAPSARNSPIT